MREVILVGYHVTGGWFDLREKSEGSHFVLKYKDLEGYDVSGFVISVK
jgi:hypothetical protein